VEAAFRHLDQLIGLLKSVLFVTYVHYHDSALLLLVVSDFIAVLRQQSAHLPRLSEEDSCPESRPSGLVCQACELERDHLLAQVDMS
jgi:hypothetical protein